MRFVKYHGLGNDFIVLLPEPAAAAGLRLATGLNGTLAKSLCARGFGIGADGVMVLAPANDAANDCAMELVNSDGSLPEMCGNGIRCLVKFAVDEAGQSAPPLSSRARETGTLRVETPGGMRACSWTLGPDGRVASVRVAMGPARFGYPVVPLLPAHSPDAPASDSGPIALEAGDRHFVGTPVNTGNPHFVTFGAWGDDRRRVALACGPTLERHAAFPARANIEFAELGRDGAIDVTVWERGCGLTWACGTGATATAAAAVHAGLAPFDRPIRVTLPGGELTITIEKDFVQTWMEGPATEVFRGDIALD